MRKITTLIAITLLIVGCSKDDNNYVLKVPNDTIELKFNETKNINATTTSGNTITYNTKDEVIAEVDANGVVKAGLIGETEIVITDNVDTKNVKIKVTPKHIIFKEPFIKFGAPQAEVENFHKGEEIKREDNLIGVMYDNYYIAYIMKDGKLEGSGIVFKTAKFDGKTIAEFMLERYFTLGAEGDKKYYFQTRDKKAIILLELDVDTSTIIYAKTPAKSSRKEINSLFKI